MTVPVTDLLVGAGQTVAAPGTELVPVTPAPIPDTNFRDTVPSGARVTYAVQAVDKAGNNLSIAFTVFMLYDADGKVTEDWKQWDDMIAIPHSIHINPYDRDRPVWVIDRDNHQIIKFSNDGKKILMKLGEKAVPGTDHGHFNRPAGIAYLPDGSFYVADGYVNSRVIKFDKDGNYRLEEN